MSPSAISNALMRSGETFQAIWDAFASLPKFDAELALPILGVLNVVVWSVYLWFRMLNLLAESHE